MMMALAGTHDLALRADSRRRHPAGRRGRGRRQGPVRRRALRPRPDHARRGRRSHVPRLRHARRRLPVPGHRRHLAGGRRSARHVAAALRAGALRPSHLARHGAPLGPRRARARSAAASPCATSSPTPPCTTPWSLHAAFGGSTNLILHLPAIAHAAGLHAPHRGRLDAHQSPGPAPRRCAAQRARSAIPPCRSSSPAACPK